MYQVYRLIRMINATYPNNRFINERDIDETTEVSEDLLDVINEALHESYKEVELDEVYSFPTNAGQAEYMLPDDCDLSQIQEVTRSFPRFPHEHSNIKPIEEIVGENRPGVEGSDNDYGDEPEPNPQPDEPVLPFSLANNDETEETEDKPNYYNGGLYPKEHYQELPEGVGVHYYTQIPRHNPFIGRARRLVFARDTECLTGDRYYNGWDSRRIGISPTPRTHSEIITIYYKKKPHDVRTKDDDIEIKDKYIHILKYNICAKLAMMGSNPDIEMANIFNRQYNDLLLEARREKDTDLPYYPHTKDNDRPSAFYRRFPRRHGRW